MSCYAAVDIGASTLRLIIGKIVEEKIVLEEIYRSPNVTVNRNSHLCWQTEALFEHIIKGLAECKKRGIVPKTLAIDTWGVDYVLLDKNGIIIGDSITYRDSRTDNIPERLEKTLPFEKHYEISGIAKQQFNTVYQLVAEFSENKEHMKADCFLMIPDYLAYLLTGLKVNEYTNASTTGMLDAEKREWSKEILSSADLPQKLFSSKPVQPGSVIGNLKKEIQERIGYDLTVITAPSHDTASAFAAVPAQNEDSVFLSSGTWSLLGVENRNVIANAETMKAGFTNEGGCFGTFRFLKNIMGLWIIQNIFRENNSEYSYPELARLAESEKQFGGRISVNDKRYLAPESMINEIRSELLERGFVDVSFAQLLSAVYHSLAECYAEAIDDLSRITKKTFTSLNIVGGGSRDDYLNRLTKEKAGITVYAGPTECTALGNLVIQMISDGVFESLSEARKVIKNSFDIKTY